MTSDTLMGGGQPVFRPRARMILLLGDQLIRDAGLAAFELVKNAYDADAAFCTVTLHDPEDPAKARIVVEDDGSGMSLKTVTEVWLEPGTDFRFNQIRESLRSPKYRRLPLGEKGVGRFAAHKLGYNIELTTRAASGPEVVVKIDWRGFETGKYLSDVPIDVRHREPEIFLGEKTGTRIEITDLRERWTRGKARDLHRSVASICSPFLDEPSSFRAELEILPGCDWLEGLLDIPSILEYSLFWARGRFLESTLEYEYHFVPLRGMKEGIAAREVRKANLAIKSTRRDGPGERERTIDLNAPPAEIGAVQFEFFVFDRDPVVLALATTDKAGLKKFLDRNGGIRVYRDGMRVFDYGELGNDWLGLGGRRVNTPAVRVSNNQIIGAISLGRESSRTLVEKTSREGFIENDAFAFLREAVLFALTQMEAERAKDKETVRKAYARSRQREPVVEEVAELREELKKRNLLEDLGRYVDRIETQFFEARDRLIAMAGAGLTLTTVIHEVEKIIKELVASVKAHVSRDRIDPLIMHLAQMVDGLSFLAKNSASRTEKASALLNQSLFNTEYRLRAHGIKVINGVDGGTPDFSVKCSRRLVVSTVMNLIDNSIYWLANNSGNTKEIYVGTSLELGGKRAIVVADNGPGFSDAPQYLVQPFFSRRPGGMGLGLHIANEVAKLHNGNLEFPGAADVGLGEEFRDGAIVAIVFPEEA